MRGILAGFCGVLACVFWTGCETTPPPDGFHYENHTVGKHPERVVVKDNPNEDNVIKVTPVGPTRSLEPGEGEHYEYQYRGRYVSKVALKDPDPNYVPIEWIEVKADQRCPKCRWDYVSMGKQGSVIKWYCDVKVHGVKDSAVNPQEKKEPVTPQSEN
jgi:hypothetical protein